MIRLITDSAADLSPQEISEWGIQIAPLLIEFPGDEVSAHEITPDAFYARLKAIAPAVPTTSQPSVGTFKQLYSAAVERGESVLSIHISSGLSNTHNSARVAMRDLPDAEIALVDSLNVSAGQRFQVLAAAMALKAGWSLPDILRRLDHIRGMTEIVFTVDTLEYLMRGGRIGRVQALAGGLLHIKPVIKLDKTDGKYSSLGRSRTISQSMTIIADYFASLYGADRPLWVTVAHGQMPDKAAAFADVLRSKLTIARLDQLQISPVLGVHTGPGVVGAGAVPFDLVGDLT